MAQQALPKKTLYCTYGGSDKIYIMWIAKAESGDGYFIWYQFGARLGGKSKPATKTTTPQTLEAAIKAFDKEVEHRKNKKHYTDPEETGQPEVEASSPVVEPSAEDRPNVDCMELTAILDATQAVAILRDDQFAAQEKHDGIRLLIHATPKKATAYNRTGGARAFPPAVEREALKVAQTIGTFTVDGELVGDKFYAFDILQFKGTDYRFPCRITKEWFKFKFVATASVIIPAHNAKRSVVMSLLHEGQLRKVGDLPIPTNKQIPPVNSIAEVRYRKADPKSLNLIEMVFLNLREDVAREDCNTSQLKFTTKAA